MHEKADAKGHEEKNTDHTGQVRHLALLLAQRAAVR
jgi:hypothetical protein